ncbi:hypothetical protein BGZ46_000328, partial [Entomortierella lignicola]
MSGAGEKSNKDKGKNVAEASLNTNPISGADFEQQLMNAPPDVQEKLRALLQQMALNSGSGAASGKEPKSMEEHKFWKTQPVVKH